jgi:hypothetical protein
MCRSKSPISTSPLNTDARPVQGHLEPTHRGHHCPKCSKHIAPHSPQAARCLKAGHIRGCPYLRRFSGVRGFGRRDCPSCLVEHQSKERHAKEDKEWETRRLEKEEENAVCCRKRERSPSAESSCSEVSISSNKGKQSKNKKQRCWEVRWLAQSPLEITRGDAWTVE